MSVKSPSLTMTLGREKKHHYKIKDDLLVLLVHRHGSSAGTLTRVSWLTTANWWSFWVLQ